MTIQERFDKHREEIMITCPEDCWCWDIESLLAALAEKEEKIQAAMEAGKMLKEQRDKAEEQIATLKAKNKQLQETVDAILGRVGGLVKCTLGEEGGNMTLQKETLVPLDESDLIAHDERQKQRIRELEAALAEKDDALSDLDFHHKMDITALTTELGTVKEVLRQLNDRDKRLTTENKRQSEEIRLLRRALGNCNPDHNLLMPEEALRGGGDGR